MTALNFMLQEDAVYIATDSLVTGDFEPAFVTTKVHVLPHLNGIICGTGSCGLILDWVRHVNGQVLASDMTVLNAFAPELLRKLHAERSEGEGTTTVYHFGMDFAEKVFRGFAYRSGTGFHSEALGYGHYLKPGVDMGDLTVEQFPADFVSIMRAQRAEQDKIEPGKRVFIGGQVLSWMMQRIEVDGIGTTVATTIQPAYEWEDFEVMYANCIAKLSSSR